MLIFYVLTIAGPVRAAAQAAGRGAAVPGLRLSRDPGALHPGGVAIAVVLLIYKPATSLPGLAIVLTGIPVYFAWRRKSS